MKTGNAITEAERITVDMPDISKVNPQFNGKVVYTSGDVKATDAIGNEIFNATSSALKVEREVEYYQYVENSRSEKRKKTGRRETVTVYTYEKIGFLRQWIHKNLGIPNM